MQYVSGCKRPTRTDQLFIETTSQRIVEVGSSLQLACNHGYKLHGPSQITCIGDNIWDPPALPTCEIGNGKLNMFLDCVSYFMKIEVTFLENNFCLYDINVTIR